MQVQPEIELNMVVQGIDHVESVKYYRVVKLA